MIRITGWGAAYIAFCVVLTASVGLGAGLAFGYGYLKAGAVLSLIAMLAIWVTGSEVKSQLEGK